MNEWKKVEDPVENTAPLRPEAAAKALTYEETGDFSVSEPDGEPEPESTKPAHPAPRASKRYTAGGRRRGRLRYAAPLGLVMILLALVGVISLAVTGVRAIQRAQDDTALKTELYDFLRPLLANYPVSAFTDANENEQDVLVLSAIWKITEKERIRMLREDDEISQYPIDDLGRMILPASEVADAYHSLFGPNANPLLKETYGGDPGGSFTYEYIDSEQAFHVPTSIDSNYVAVIDTLKKKGNRYTLRIGYVNSQNIGVDDKGELVSATPDMAESRQDYVLEKNGDAWMLVSVTDV